MKPEYDLTISWAIIALLTIVVLYLVLFKIAELRKRNHELNNQLGFILDESHTAQNECEYWKEQCELKQRELEKMTRQRNVRIGAALRINREILQERFMKSSLN